MKSNKRREELLKKIKEKKIIEKHRERYYKKQRAEAEIMLQVYSILGYMALEF